MGPWDPGVYTYHETSGPDRIVYVWIYRNIFEKLHTPFDLSPNVTVGKVIKYQISFIFRCILNQKEILGPSSICAYR